jgi:hypothetical protein
MSGKSAKRERKVKAGELENVKAVEEVTRRNVQSGMLFANDTRKMVLELRVMFDALQNNVLNMKNEIAELRRQLAFVQQRQVAGGTKDYGDQC